MTGFAGLGHENGFQVCDEGDEFFAVLIEKDPFILEFRADLRGGERAACRQSGYDVIVEDTSLVVAGIPVVAIVYVIAPRAQLRLSCEIGLAFLQ